jgi:hypothetical protein
MPDPITPTPEIVTPEAPEPRTFSQDAVNSLMGRTRDEAKQRAEADMLKRLGIDSLDDATALITEARQRKEADMSAAEKLTAELEAERKLREAAEARIRQSDLSALRAKVAREVAKDKGIALDTAETLAPRLVGDDEAAIKADAEAMFASLPRGATPPPTAVDDLAAPTDMTQAKLDAMSYEQRRAFFKSDAGKEWLATHS